MIVRVADVARVVALARETGLELAVRSGGHSTAGHSVAEGGIVLDLGDVKAMDIVADRRMAWAETGLIVSAFLTSAGSCRPRADPERLGSSKPDRHPRPTPMEETARRT